MADKESAINLANSNDSPADNGSIRLQCRRWTRFGHASGAVLPKLVDIDMHGVTAHAWEMATAESILNPFGWVTEIHKTTRNRDDYSSFRVKVWCFDPDRLPPRRDLVVCQHRPTRPQLRPTMSTTTGTLDRVGVTASPLHRRRSMVW